eukprot:COSAG02_NODE_857_length_16462_cov_4.801381_1_plen_311_part_00
MVLAHTSSGNAGSIDAHNSHHSQLQGAGGRIGPSAGGLTSTTQIDIGEWWAVEHRAAALTQLNDLDCRTRNVPNPRWQSFVSLLSSASAFVAAMAWGRFLTAELDTDGVVDGKYNSDQPLPLDWSLVPTMLYLFGVMWLVFFLMHRIHRYRDRVELSNDIWLERQQHWCSHATDNLTNGSDEAEDEVALFEAEKQARQLHAHFLNRAVLNFTNSWTYTSMFMWTVLLHSFTVTLDYEGDLRTFTALFLVRSDTVCLPLISVRSPFRRDGHHALRAAHTMRSSGVGCIRCALALRIACQGQSQSGSAAQSG